MPNSTPLTKDCDVLILGAGLTGLAAANVLQERAVVLERDDRPGGLVRTECFHGYWFDRVIHLLYFADPRTKERITALMGGDLAACPPAAYVECAAGTVPFPFQTHLAGLERGTLLRCLDDFAREAYGPQGDPPQNFEEMLLRSFGQTMCDTFFFPYNRKLWKRALHTLAPSGFQWNIQRPDFPLVLRGSLSANEHTPSYNAEGWYPRPPPNAPVRGMEVMARALARQVPTLRLNQEVVGLNLERREVLVREDATLQRLHFQTACLNTLPLPTLVTLCPQVPAEMKRACATLTRNRVVSVAISVEGERPQGRGHWRYYSDESIWFNRLVYLNEFDPDCTPEQGWALLAEITEPAEQPNASDAEIITRTLTDVERVGGIPSNCRVVDTHIMRIDPAYVVFTTENQGTVEAICAFFAEYDVTLLGRYGRWEYSSMAQVMRDGFHWGEELLDRRV